MLWVAAAGDGDGTHVVEHLRDGVARAVLRVVRLDLDAGCGAVHFHLLCDLHQRLALGLALAVHHCCRLP